MNSFFKKRYAVLPALMLCLAMPPARAHLMVAQHGTLNIVGHDVFMVLSLPISAFDDVDDDNNGEVSMIEFNRHRAAIVESARRNVVLSDAAGERHLRGATLSPMTSDHATHAQSASVSQVIVMGRFALHDAVGTLSFRATLYGTGPAERSLEMTAIRRADNRKQVFELTAKRSSAPVFRDPGFSSSNE